MKTHQFRKDELSSLGGTWEESVCFRSIHVTFVSRDPDTMLFGDFNANFHRFVLAAFAVFELSTYIRV